MHRLGHSDAVELAANLLLGTADVDIERRRPYSGRTKNRALALVELLVEEYDLNHGKARLELLRIVKPELPPSHSVGEQVQRALSKIRRAI
jgi:hypothetical protein